MKVLYVLSKPDGEVYALQPNNGDVLWKKLFPPLQIQQYAASASSFYVGTGEGYIWALNAQNGALLWKHAAAEGTSPTSLKVDTKGIYYTTYQGIFALNPMDGTLLWHYSAHTSQPVVIAVLAENIMYVFFNDGFYALETETGSLLWFDTRFQLIPTYPVATHRKVYVPTKMPAQFFVLRANDGRELYQLYGNSIVVGDDIVYINDLERGLYALNPQDDSIVWHEPEVTFALSAVGNGMLYSTSSVGALQASRLGHARETTSSSIGFSTNVYGLRIQDRTLQWHWQRLNVMGISSHPVVIDGNIYFTTGSGGCHALRGHDGTVLWHVLKDKLFPSNPIAG